MHNTYFILPTYDYNDTYTIADIFETNKRGVLPDLFISDNESAFYYIIISDNITLEQISYNQYGRSDYWDILAKINQMTSPFDLPKSAEYVISVTENEIEKWGAKFPNLTEDLLAEKYNEILEEQSLLNEKHRKFRCLKESYISLMYKALNEQ